ncbi:MAG: molybdenum cofactor biosynthesis protein MoaE [Acidimicrobiales bacterium]
MERPNEPETVHAVPMWVQITEQSLDVNRAYEWLTVPEAGAVVLFSGTVRNNSEGRSGVSALVYEAYEGPAHLAMQRIANAIANEFDEIQRVVIWHRLGEMSPTVSTVIVGVSSAHREAAFAAAKYGIDTLKASVPIWKKEFFEGGAEWGLGAIPLSDSMEESKP